MLEERFVRPAGLDSSAALLRAVANTPGDEWSVEVLLKTRVDDASWRLPSIGLVLEETQGGCSTWSLDWVARVLAGLDCSFVVRRPVELREALERRAERISTLAKHKEEASS